ncbi:MAG: phosphate/phosphite/phosphonate ABC transporter substrate-binding protein [Bacteroidetes bacterium]|nr:MAG: phosphate/phosphite/phosphonate ABC transporter substrate-binding protein [Bacteroidota bacterium]
MKLLNLIIVILIVISACNRKPREVIEIDQNNRTRQEAVEDDTIYNPLKVAVSAILSPRETYESYEKIFKYISDEMGYPIEFHQRKTYAEINQMLEAGQLDFAFICTGAYVELDYSKDVELLAVPVSAGKPYYNAYIIASEAFAAESFEDLRGSRFAFTDPLSNTGYLYALHRLKDFNETYDSFFESTMFTYGHDISIQLVAKGVVDAATINQLIFDYLKVYQPERIEGVRIIEVSPDYGNPPIVISQRLKGEKREQLKQLFLLMHTNTEASSILDDLLVDRFIEGEDENYNSVREMKQRLLD